VGTKGKGKMRQCKVCGGEYRVGKLAYVVEKGRLRLVHMCQACTSGGVLVIAKTAASFCSCGAKATKCHECGTRAEQRDKTKSLQAVLKTVKAWRRGTADYLERAEWGSKEHETGRVAAFDAVIELIESGRF